MIVIVVQGKEFEKKSTLLLLFLEGYNTMNSETFYWPELKMTMINFLFIQITKNYT